jgi:hypothetical protein
VPAVEKRLSQRPVSQDYPTFLFRVYIAPPLPVHRHRRIPLFSRGPSAERSQKSYEGDSDDEEKTSRNYILLPECLKHGGIWTSTQILGYRAVEIIREGGEGGIKR